MDTGWRHDLGLSGLALLCMAVLTWPLVLHPSEMLLSGPFAPSIALSFELVPEAVWSGQDPHRLSELGAPMERNARYLGWVLLLLAVPLKFLGPVRFASLVTLASPAVAVLCMARLLRARAPDGSAPARAFASFSFAFAPFYLANMANGELAKSQAWLLPLCLLWAFEARRRWSALPIVGLLLILTGLTSPYLLVCTGLALGVDALFSWRAWRRHLPMLALLGVALLVTSAAFAQDGPGHLWLFSPTHRPKLETPAELVAPYAVAPLSALFWPSREATPSGVQHGVYLCWSVLLPGLWGIFRARGVAWAWVLAGVVGALGPTLFLTPSWGTGLLLPMALVELLETGLSSSGMYYRLLQVGLLGLALAIAHLPLPRWALLPLGLVFATEVWLNQGSLPLPTETLPHAELAAEIAKDPLPGSVLDLPGWPRGETNRPHAMAFRLRHGRPITALPRMPKHPLEYSLCMKPLDRCVEQGRGCQAVQWPQERLESRGVRFVVVHLDRGYETANLVRVLTKDLGTPEVWDDALLWRVVPDRVPSTDWSCDPPGGNLAPPPDVR